MSRTAMTGTGVVAALVFTGCGTARDAGADPAGEADGIDVEARHDVLVTEEALGDVATGTLEAGDAARALCYVAEAQSQTGTIGDAIRIESGELAGYAAVTDFPDDPADRNMVFDVDQENLRDRLPTCSDG